MDFLLANQATIIGIIFMLVLGPAVGNYACSVVYRLPLGKTPFERHPYCGHCNADLKPKDLAPILSWLSTKGKCRYCRGAIPGVYTLIELACGVVFIAYFLHFGMGEQFLLATAFAVFAIILAAIQWQQGWIAASIFGYAFTAIALARTLADHAIYGWVQSSFVMLVIGLVLSAGKTPFEKPWIWWMVLMAAWVPFSQWQLLAVPTAFLLLSAIPALRRYRVIALPITALMLPLFVQ